MDCGEHEQLNIIYVKSINKHWINSLLSKASVFPTEVGTPGATTTFTFLFTGTYNLRCVHSYTTSVDMNLQNQRFRVSDM